MRALPHLLAATGRGSRAAFGLAALAALAAHLWPVAVPAVPQRQAPSAVAPADGSALRRPLFDPGRRAWTARGSRDAILQGEPARPVLTVRGILLEGGRARALIDDGSGDQTWLARGDGRGDWRVSAVAPNRVGVTQRGRTFEAEFMGQPMTLRPAPLDGAPAGLRP